MKIQELNWEIKQLKEDDNISGTDDEDTKAFFRETMNFVKELKNPNQNPQPTAAPIGNTESSEKKPNEMTSLLMRWKDADADVLYTVMMIVNIAENNPLVYEAAKAQLKQYN